MLKALYWILLAMAFATLGASYNGALHPAGDSLAVFRLHIAGLCLLLCLPALRLHRRVALAGLVSGALALTPVLLTSFIAIGPTQGQASLYQKNMLYRSRDLAALAGDIRAANPDALTLQEVTPANTALLATLADILPSQLVCPFARVGAVAVASRWPLIEGSTHCEEGQGMAAIRVTTPQGPLWIVSLHLHWPWPHDQAPQLDSLLPALGALQGPVLIGGDFNMVPWSHTLRSIARASGTRRIGRAFNTMTRFALVPLPIDHILLPKHSTGITELRPLLGSDHHGILARFSLPGG